LKYRWDVGLLTWFMDESPSPGLPATLSEREEGFYTNRHLGIANDALHCVQHILRALIKSFARLRTNGNVLIPFVVSLSNHERNPLVHSFLYLGDRMDRYAQPFNPPSVSFRASSTCSSQMNCSFSFASAGISSSSF
jgi:hypothetical protein